MSARLSGDKRKDREEEADAAEEAADAVVKDEGLSAASMSASLKMDDDSGDTAGVFEGFESRAQIFLEGRSQDVSQAETLLEEIQNTSDGMTHVTEIRKLERLCGELRYCVKILKSQSERAEAHAQTRVADVSFDIESVPMTYRDDLNRFATRVKELFGWKGGFVKRGGQLRNIHDIYLAPYFPLVQCSGTGKTKLMYEYRQATKRQSEGSVKCVLVLCHGASRPTENTNVFDHYLDVATAPSEGARVGLWRALNNMISGDEEKVIMMFDESQCLLDEREGWYFRSIRWWLRSQRDKNVVAVFAGTATQIVKLYADPPDVSSTSRDSNLQYTGAGTKLYPPFFEITTTGLVARTDPYAATDMITESTDMITEYDIAVQYGRPLFARMQIKRDLEKNLATIMKRMLGGSELQCDYSVIATRVQMGQVTFDFASKVVASGYAHLTHFSPEHPTVADIAFLPDPVCARLAMSRMIEGCNLFNDTNDGTMVDGKSPSYWSEKAIDIFSTGLCRPEKGDVGEVAAAFYMLACGDKLRYRASQDLKHFSVPLHQWIGVMTASDALERTSATISFIQVCRNYLRHEVCEMSASGLLEHWYKSGRALYGYASCPAYDIIAPVRYEDKGEFCYCPMLVSVKNRAVYRKAERLAAMAAMKAVFTKGHLTTGVCLLLLIGLDESATLSSRPSPPFKEGEVTCIEVVVPEEDEYGATALSQSPTCGGGERSEVLASHAEVALAADHNFQRLLRSKTAPSHPSAQLLTSVARAFSSEELERDVTSQRDETKGRSKGKARGEWRKSEKRSVFMLPWPSPPKLG